MDLEMLLKFVVEQAYVLIPALWILGMFLKNTPKVQDWVIPWVLLVAGIAGAVALMGVTAEAVLQGIIVTGVAVLGYNLYKQTTQRN